MDDATREFGKKMNILMSGTMSVVLSLFGTLTSGQFTWMGFLSSVVISFIVAFLIGLLIPSKKITADFDQKHGIDPNSTKGRLVNTLISDLIYTPILTLVMVFVAWRGTGGAAPFLPMFFSSLIKMLIVAYILIWFVEPVLVKIAMKGTDIPH